MGKTEHLNQIQTNEVPLLSLSLVNYVCFSELIVKLGRRPERPEEDEAPQMTDALWQLAERCWTTDPTGRPTANAICDDMSHQLRESEFSLKQRVEPGSSHTSPRHNATITRADGDTVFDTNSISGSVSADKTVDKICTSF
jgi:hypothetical protein